MKKLLGTLLVYIVLNSFSYAQTINLYLPVKPGGNISAIGLIITEDMKARGYDVVPILNGDCASTNDIVNNTKDPVMFMWFSVWHDQYSTTDACGRILPDVDKSFIAILSSFDDMLCSVGKDVDFFDVERGTVRLAVRPPEEFKKEFKDLLQDNTKANIRYIEYHNSGARRTAIASGEVDFFLSGEGPRFMATGQAYCHYYTGSVPMPGYKHITEKIPAYGIKEYSFYIDSVNLPLDTKKNVTDAINDILSTNEELKVLYKTIGYYVPQRDTEEIIQSLE